jgi:hypothetical protein
MEWLWPTKSMPKEGRTLFAISLPVLIDAWRTGVIILEITSPLLAGGEGSPLRAAKSITALVNAAGDHCACGHHNLFFHLVTSLLLSSQKRRMFQQRTELFSKPEQQLANNLLLIRANQNDS